jgi:hypothetical protein
LPNFLVRLNPIYLGLRLSRVNSDYFIIPILCYFYVLLVLSDKCQISEQADELFGNSTGLFEAMLDTVGFPHVFESFPESQTIFCSLPIACDYFIDLPVYNEDASGLAVG